MTISVDTAATNHVVTRRNAQHLSDVFGSWDHAGGVARRLLADAPRRLSLAAAVMALRPGGQGDGACHHLCANAGDALHELLFTQQPHRAVRSGCADFPLGRQRLDAGQEVARRELPRADQVAVVARDARVRRPIVGSGWPCHVPSPPSNYLWVPHYTA